VLRVVLGALILLATMTAIRQDRIGVRETDVFRLVNDLALPWWTKWPVWLVMQLGVIGAVPLVALLALATRRLRLAAYAALAGGTIYGGTPPPSAGGRLHAMVDDRGALAGPPRAWAGLAASAARCSTPWGRSGAGRRLTARTRWPRRASSPTRAPPAPPVAPRTTCNRS
jgi:hypothetical protein